MTWSEYAQILRDHFERNEEIFLKLLDRIEVMLVVIEEQRREIKELKTNKEE